MMKKLLKLLLRFYQLLLSPVLFLLSGSGCRFEPSCSSYMYQAIDIHGPAKGTWLGFKRLCRCHPWGGGAGYDPVPPARMKCEKV